MDPGVRVVDTVALDLDRLDLAEQLRRQEDVVKLVGGGLGRPEGPGQRVSVLATPSRHALVRVRAEACLLGAYRPES